MAINQFTNEIFLYFHLVRFVQQKTKKYEYVLYIKSIFKSVHSYNIPINIEIKGEVHSNSSHREKEGLNIMNKHE